MGFKEKNNSESIANNKESNFHINTFASKFEVKMYVYDPACCDQNMGSGSLDLH